MALTFGAVAVPLLVVAALVSVAVAVLAARHRQEPGATPFALLMLSLSIWSGGYAVALLVHDPAQRVLWEYVQWIGAAPIHVWMLLFALAYTGHDELVTRRAVALLGTVPVATLALVWTNDAHHLMWADPEVTYAGGLALIEFDYGPAFWVFTPYTYAVIAVGAALLLRLVFVSDYLYADQSALLVAGTATPMVANVLDNLVGGTGPSVDITPLAITVTGLTFGYALFRRRLFDLVPATRQLGRSAAIGQLDAGVVIVDNDRRVVYCNAAAADVFDVDPADALGRATDTLVDESRLDFDAEDALAEVERGERTYEIRTSPVSDRHDRRIGHTLVIHDVTARKRRERRLAAQRDELARLDELNATIRGVNQALVSATSREEVEREVCERVVEADRYATACVGDVATWTGEADRWFVTGRGAETDGAPPDIGDGIAREDVDVTDESRSLPAVDPDATAEDDTGAWVVVPLAYGRTVYGALGLYTETGEVSDREREVLGELGETIGLAINAVETQQLLSADSVVELELECTDADAPLVAAATAGAPTDDAARTTASATLDVAGLVPGDGGTLAYVRVEDGDADRVHDRLVAAASGAVRTVRGGEDADAVTPLLEWQVTGDGLLGFLADQGAHVRRARAADGRAQVAVELPSDADVRELLDAVEGPFPETRLVSKRERAHPVDESAGALTEDGLDDLTDRQREVIEVAYRAGYFNWPRDSTAEEVADSLDISSPTLHSHLRSAEQSLLGDLFDPDPPQR